MARYLVLDWDHNQFNLLSATVKQGGVRIGQALSLATPVSPLAADAETLGQVLKERLKAAGIAPAPVIVCVGRDRVILKEIRFPQVPAAEEPNVVRFQVVKELTSSVDESIIDYVTTGSTGTNGDQRALVLIARRDLLAAYQDICRAAGLKLAAVTPRPFGTAACLRSLGVAVADETSPVPPLNLAQDAVAVLTVTDRWAEFGVVRGRDLLLIRNMSVLPSGQENALLGEIRRNLAVYAGQSPQHPVRALYLAGGEPAALRERLRNTLAIPVCDLEPFIAGTPPGVPDGERGSFAGMVGLLHALAEKRALPINFVQPKQARAPRDPHRRSYLLAAGIAVLVLVGLVSWCSAQLSAQNRTIQRLRAESADLDTLVAQADEDTRRIKALNDWAATDVCWLDELHDLTDRLRQVSDQFKDANKMRLTQLTADPLSRAGKDRHVAKMTVKGICTDDHRPVDNLIARLVEDPHLRVEPKSMDRNSGTERFRYPQQFSTRVDIEKRPRTHYSRELPPLPVEKPPERPRRPDRRQADPELVPFGFEGGMQP